MIVNDPVCGMPVDTGETKFKLETRGRVYYFCSEYDMRFFLKRPYIAYFSMEVGIKSEIPTYSGGLGALAGDTIRSSADLRIPIVAVTLVSRKGYLMQKITGEGEQLELSDEWSPAKFMILLPAEARVRIEGRDVKIRTWIYDHKSPTGVVVPVLFLDTDVEGNTAEDRRITDFLYGGDDRYRLKQEMVLGLGGIRMLEALNFNIRKYHMNEGHSSLLTLELLKKSNMDAEKVRDICIFTTHTPVESAIDKYPYDLVEELLKGEFPVDVLKQHGEPDRLNMTHLALNLSKYVNGVTRAHMEFSKKLFPGHHIEAVTNGVHSYTWTCECFKELFNRFIPRWANEPALLVRADEIPNEDMWHAHMDSKTMLLDFVRGKTGVQMDPSTLTIGFARRATAYKRASLIFSDIERLRDINEGGKLQLILAGKAHPLDSSGKRIIREIHDQIAQLKKDIKIVYLENYDTEMAKRLTSGVDVWLNTPLPPMEASGTSGMKAAHNGVVNFSVLDGWWIEGWMEDATGWAIGPPPDENLREEERRKRELRDLYNKLEYVIIPKFYNERDEWIKMMKNSISKVAYYFNSHRMMMRYVTEAYLV